MRTTKYYIALSTSLITNLLFLGIAQANETTDTKAITEASALDTQTSTQTEDIQATINTLMAELEKTESDSSALDSSVVSTATTSSSLAYTGANSTPPETVVETTSKTSIAAKTWWQEALDNPYYKINLDFRARMELADFNNPPADQADPDGSQAMTFRTRFGVGSKEFYGFSGMAEGEGTFSADTSLYFDTVSEANGQTPVADPETFELNRLWLQYANKGLANLKLKAGRQRIVLDDARFIGNVIWRQNEQTYDSAMVQTNGGLENLSFTYAYLLNVRRIFGDQGPPNRRDFESDSHILNAQYALPRGINLTGFVYLLNFENSPGNSSNTYGGRIVTSQNVKPVKLGLIASYARQTEAGDNPVDYNADYVAIEASVGHKLGAIKTGFELLGSDDGEARFVTPLSTAHKFNGYADVFLNNGGTNGLQDLYLTVSPKLPYGFGGFATYHRFWSHEGGQDLGNEFDFVVKRAFGKHLGGLVKGAYFIADNSSSLRDTWRLTFDLNVSY